jgi:hypothetical protein
MLLRISAALCIAALWAGPAWAADLADSDYTAKFFGTVVTFKLAAPLPLPDGGYWTDKLPLDLQDPTYIAGKVNPARQAAGRTDLVKEDDLLFTMVGDDPGNTGSYSFGYAELTPKEVGLLLSSVDNLKSVFPSAQISYSPLTERLFDFSTDSLSGPIVFDKAGVQITVQPGTSAQQMLASFNAAFKQHFGGDAAVSYLSYTEAASDDGTGGRYISFDARIGPAPAPPAE